jgi:DNA-binding response OmpR family regulator
VSDRVRVLIIDDELKTLELLAMRLTDDGYLVEKAATGEQGLRMAYTFHPDVIILDIIMPGMDGLQVCKQLRVMTDAVILFVTVRSRTEDVVRGLREGADDYIIKPYKYQELRARIVACLRRRKETKLPPLRLAQGEAILTTDPSRRLIFLNDGRSVQLTPTEFELLEYLIKNQGRVLSADAILANVWGPGYSGEHQLVKQFIYRLRSKLEPDPSDPEYILTVRGSGYTFEEDTRPGVGRSSGRAQQRRAVGDGAALRHLEARERPTPSMRYRPGDIDMQLLGRVSRRSWVRNLALGLIMALAASGGAFVVAGHALPGESLYPLKTGMEQVRLLLNGDSVGDAQLHLQFASNRLGEAEKLIDQEKFEALPTALVEFEGEVEGASEIMTAAFDQGQPQAFSIRSIVEFNLAAYGEILAYLYAEAPVEAQGIINDAMRRMRSKSTNIHDDSGSASAVPEPVSTTPIPRKTTFERTRIDEKVGTELPPQATATLVSREATPRPTAKEATPTPISRGDETARDATPVPQSTERNSTDTR